MPRGHHFTTCRLCGKEYVCGDCITDGCELGHGKKSCEGYKVYLRQEAASAKGVQAMFTHPEGKVAAAARMLADYHWDKLVKELSNTDLADAILKEIWANQEIGSREGALIAETIERLRAGQPNDRSEPPEAK